MARVLYVRKLDPDDARAAARVERRLYPRIQRSGRRSIAIDLDNADFDDSNLSAGLFDGSTLVAYMLAYVVEDRRSVFDDSKCSTKTRLT